MAKTRYFTIMHGLRGCYMPDGEPYVVRCITRGVDKRWRKSQANRVADRIDGYDRDDLGESPDY